MKNIMDFLRRGHLLADMSGGPGHRFGKVDR
jgi:hypothetical protein